MVFSDIHTHALFGVDDGAKTEKEMLALVKAAYDGGTRLICLTPHFHPGYYGDNRAKVKEAYEMLKSFVNEELPDLKLCLGNELRYSPDCISWLRDGECSTMNGTRNVLVDFSSEEEERVIVRALDQMLNAGYRPILAHVERYSSLKRSREVLARFKDNGVLMQINSQALTGEWGLTLKNRCARLLAEGLVDLVCSDCHDMKDRRPGLSAAHAAIAKRYENGYADALCSRNAAQIVNVFTNGKETD